jgi:hypothetical protein
VNVPGRKHLSAAEAAALRDEVAAIRRRLGTIFAMLPPPEREDDIVRYSVRTRRRDDEIPELSVRSTGRLVGVSDSTVRVRIRDGGLEHRRTPMGHLRISAKAALKWYEERNGPLPD